MCGAALCCCVAEFQIYLLCIYTLENKRTTLVFGFRIVYFLGLFVMENDPTSAEADNLFDKNQSKHVSYLIQRYIMS